MKQILIILVIVYTTILVLLARSLDNQQSYNKQCKEMGYIKGMLDSRKGRDIVKQRNFELYITEDIIEGIPNEFEVYGDYIRSLK